MNLNILSHISGFSEEYINNLTPPHFFKKGINHFTNADVAEYGWSKDGKKLLATVETALRNYLVAITDAPTKYMCSCIEDRKNLSSPCEHILASLLVLRALMHDAKISVKLQKKKDQLLQQVRGEISSHLSLINNFVDIKEAGWELLISKGQPNTDQITFNVRRIGQYVNPISHDKIRQLFESFKADNNNHEKFTKLIKYFSDNHSIYYNINKTLISVLYNESVTLTPVTRFDFTRQEISVEYLGRQNNQITSDFLPMRGLFIDFNKNVIGKRIDNVYQENWEVAKSLPKMNIFKPTPYNFGFEVSIQDFNNRYGRSVYYDQLNPKAATNFIYQENGKSVELKKIEPQYAVSLVRSRDSMILKLDAFIDGIQIDRQELPLFFHKELENLFVSAHNIKNLPKNFMEEIGVPTVILALKVKESHELIKASIQGVHYLVNKKALLERLTTMCNSLQTKKMAHVVAYKEHFCIVEHDYKKIWLIYALYHTMLHGRSHDLKNMTFTVDLAQLFGRFKKFKDALDAQGIGLYLNNKKAHIVNLDVNVDASRSDEIDWFEVKPEIKMKGELISDDEWQQVIDGGSFERKNDIFLADLDSTKLLELLGKFFGKIKNNQEKQSVVRKRLQIFDVLLLIQNKINVSLAKKDKEIVDSLINFKCIPATKLANVQATLRDYQKDGYNWLAFLYKHRFGACLADDMGLGKTIQAISFLGGIKEGSIESPYAKKAPHLVVVPPNLVFNWSREIEKFYPSFKVQEYIGNQREMLFEDHDVIITSYDTVRIDQEEFNKKTFDVIIFDEAQTVKNLKAQRTAAARTLKGNFKLCLTGTPLENNITEYYSIIDLAVPGLLPNEKVLMQEMKEMNTNSLAKTKPFVLRRTKSAILHELPPKQETDTYLVMTDAQKKIYNKITNEVKGIVDAAFAKNTKAQANIVALTALLRLRQICISPELVGIQNAQPSPKIEYIIDKMREIVNEGHAALIFSQFLTTFDVLEKAFKKEKIPYLRIDGTTSLAKRKEIVDAFEKERKVPILLLSLKVGGVGLNLIRANYVFHVDPWWNPAVENQATDRAHRIGQQNKVMVTRLIMKHSVEEKMMVLKQRKKALFDAIMEGTLDKGGAITKEDFDFLLN